MAEEILHTGRILEINPQFTTVEIVSESACSACHAKSLCGLGESKTKVIELPTRPWENRQPGDTVTVALKASMGHKAVWLAYVFPLIVLLCVLMTLLYSGVSEIVSGLSGLAAAAFYYFLLWIFRKKLRNEYIFNLK